MQRLITWLRCHWFGDHQWSSRALEGFPPTGPDEMPEPGDTADVVVRKFYTYARMYCQHCHHPSRFNKV